MCGIRSDCSRMGSLGLESSLICFYKQLDQEVSNISVYLTKTGDFYCD